MQCDSMKDLTQFLVEKNARADENNKIAASTLILHMLTFSKKTRCDRNEEKIINLISHIGYSIFCQIRMGLVILFIYLLFRLFNLIVRKIHDNSEFVNGNS